MKFLSKISLSVLIIILCSLVVTQVSAEGYGVLDSGTSGTVNVISSSSGNLENVMNTLPTVDENGDVINPSSKNLNNTIMNSLPSVDKDGNAINPSSDNLGTTVNSLPSVDKDGNVINPSSDNLGTLVNSLPSEKEESRSNDLKVYYLNTSHGDATLLESSGHFMMIDAGDQQDSSAVIDYLTKSGVKTLDYVLATNLNESSIGGATNLMEAFPVSIFSSASNSFSSPTNGNINAMIQDKAIGYQQAIPGDSLPFGTASIQFLNTSTSGNNASDNAMSVLISTGKVTFLFTGNQNLGSIPATIWAVPNQGDEGALTALSDISPQFLIINPGTAGINNQTQVTLKELKIEPLLTSADGNIMVSTDGIDYQINTGSGKTFQKPVQIETSTLQASQVMNSTSNETQLPNRVAVNSVI